MKLSDFDQRYLGVYLETCLLNIKNSNGRTSNCYANMINGGHCNTAVCPFRETKYCNYDKAIPAAIKFIQIMKITKVRSITIHNIIFYEQDFKE